jgi:hypothetical protein
MGRLQGKWSGRADLTASRPPTSASGRFVFGRRLFVGRPVRPDTLPFAE